MYQTLPKNLRGLRDPEDGDTAVLRSIGKYFAIQHGLISQKNLIFKSLPNRVSGINHQINRNGPTNKLFSEPGGVDVHDRG